MAGLILPGPNRPPPRLPVQAVQTYQVASPADTTIVAACEQVGCPMWLDGGDTIVDEATPLGQAQARFIRSGDTGRSYRELGRTAEGRTVFRFEAHQRCFAEHQTRAELYVVRHGDWRGNPSGRSRQHARPADWVEDFAEHQDRIQTAIQQG
jgi:hypothetical protein